MFNSNRGCTIIKERSDNINTKGVFSHNSDEWSTPQELFDSLNAINNFTLDPCATEENHKCNTYFTKTDNGLTKDWSGHSVFVNPPYSACYEWVKKCEEEWRKHNINIVLLLPVRTDTKWFHEFLYNRSWVKITFLRGRLKFGSSKNTAPFPSMIVQFRKVVSV